MMYKAALSLLGLTCTAAAAPQNFERVENGLLPPVSIVGEAARGMSLADRMAHYKVPAVSMALIENNRIAWTRSYGVITRAGMKPVTAETLFQVGSLSKPVTAAGVLSLARDGKLSLDVPVNSYLTSWKLPDSKKAEGRPVTLRGILSHSAGLTVQGFRGYGAGEKVPTLLEILDGAAPANSPAVRVDQVPGSTMRYSGGGYLVAQQAMIDVTGKPFPELMRQRVLRPIGMRNSTFEQPLPERLAPMAAIGHKRDGSSALGGWHTVPEMAAGGLWSTPTDMARFIIWAMKGLKEKASPEHRAIVAQMVEPQVDLAGNRFANEAGQNVGLGFGVALKNDRPAQIGFSGTVWGYTAIMIGFPETGQGAVLMANSDGGGQLLREIARSLASEYRWPERLHKSIQPAALGAAALQALAGTYRWKAGDKERQIVMRPSEGALLADLPDGSKPRIYPESPTRFIDPNSGRTFIFDQPATLRIPQIGVTAKRD